MAAVAGCLLFASLAGLDSNHWRHAFVRRDSDVAGASVPKVRERTRGVGEDPRRAKRDAEPAKRASLANEEGPAESRPR
jgi:hypothetical protein